MSNTFSICNIDVFFIQSSLDLMSKGHMLADVVAIIGETSLAIVSPSYMNT